MFCNALSLYFYKNNVYSLRVERVSASGGEVGRLNVAGGAEVCSLIPPLAVEFIFGQGSHCFSTSLHFQNLSYSI